jgi:hypothetical protein
MYTNRTLIATTCMVLRIHTAAASGQPAMPAVVHEIQRLIVRDVPVGVVLTEEEISAVHSGGMEEADSDIARLAQRLADRFSVRSDGPVVALSSWRATQCERSLSATLPALQLSGSPLEIVFALVARDASAPGRLPPAALGAKGADRSQSRRSQVVAIDVREGDTLRMALNQVASVGLPLGWGVVERSSGPMACQLVLLTEDTIGWTPYDIAAKTQN